MTHVRKETPSSVIDREDVFKQEDPLLYRGWLVYYIIGKGVVQTIKANIYLLK